MDSLPVIDFDQKTLELVYHEADSVQISSLMLREPHDLDAEHLTHFRQQLRRRLIETAHFFLSVAEVPDPEEPTLPILSTPVFVHDPHERAMQAAFARE